MRAHKLANVLNALPQSVQPAARRTLAAVRDAEEHDHTVAAMQAFAREFGAKWSKASAGVVDGAGALFRVSGVIEGTSWRRPRASKTWAPR